MLSLSFTLRQQQRYLNGDVLDRKKRTLYEQLLCYSVISSYIYFIYSNSFLGMMSSSRT